MSLQLGVHFGMREPQGWAAFKEAAEANVAEIAAIDGLKPDWRRRVTSLATELVSLSNEEIEGYRYYALGEAVCDLAKILRSPEAQADVVEQRAAEIVAYHSIYAEKNGYPPDEGLHTCELYQWTRDKQNPLTGSLVRAIPESRLLASDSLSAVKEMRFCAMKDGSAQVPVANFAPFPGDSIRNVANQLLSGASDATIRGI